MLFVIHIIKNKSNLSSKKKNQKEHEEYMGMKSISM